MKLGLFLVLLTSCNLFKMMGEKSEIKADKTLNSAHAIAFFNCIPSGYTDAILCSFESKNNTIRYHEISPGMGPYNAQNLTLIDGRVYMSAEGMTGIQDREPYVYDIENDFLTLMGDLNPSTASSFPAAFYKITTDKVGFIAEVSASTSFCQSNTGPYTISSADCTTMVVGGASTLGPSIGVAAGVIYTADGIGNALPTSYGVYYCSGSNLAIFVGNITYNFGVTCDASMLKKLKDGGLLTWNPASAQRDIFWTGTGGVVSSTVAGMANSDLISYDQSGNMTFRWFDGSFNHLYYLPVGSNTPQIVRNDYTPGEIVVSPVIIQSSMVFYTNVDVNNVDQVFSYNLGTNTTTQLTNFTNTNYFIKKMYLVGEYIYLLSEYTSPPNLSSLYRVHVTGSGYQQHMSSYIVDASQEIAIFPL